MLSLVTRLLSPRYRSIKKPSKLVAIVVPIFDRPDLTADEEISVRHMRRFLGNYDKFLLVPKGLEFELDGFKSLHLSRKFYGSRWAHSLLLYSPSFYKMFADYKYILIHHLDALVFSDALAEWCGTDIDYIGPPWIAFPDAPKWLTNLLTRAMTLENQGAGDNFATLEPRVGNGGLALMKVQSVLSVLEARHRSEPVKYLKGRLANAVESLMVPFPRSPYVARIRRRLRRFGIEELSMPNDEFWSLHAVRYLPSFHVPDWKTGLRFAFEFGPRHCFELNGRKLPFGCHRPDWDPSFWEPYIIKE